MTAACSARLNHSHNPQLRARGICSIPTTQPTLEWKPLAPPPLRSLAWALATEIGTDKREHCCELHVQAKQSARQNFTRAPLLHHTPAHPPAHCLALQARTRMHILRSTRPRSRVHKHRRTPPPPGARSCAKGSGWCTHPHSSALNVRVCEVVSLA